MSDKGTLKSYDKMKKNRGGVMAKKEGINTLQRLMNVVFIVWVLWFLYIMFGAVITGELFKLTWSDIEATPIPFALLFLGWLLVMTLNYILNKKATVWNKAETD